MLWVGSKFEENPLPAPVTFLVNAEQAGVVSEHILCQNPTPAHLSAANGTKANCAKLFQSRWLFLIDENI